MDKIKLDELDINVLLIKALGFTTAEETIEFYLCQRLTRSVVTSWGQTYLEEICKIAGAKGIPSDDNVGVKGKNFDVMKVVDGTSYYIQIKSGPNTMNLGMVASLNDMIEIIENKHSDAVGILGMTYGKKSQISSQIRSSLIDFENKAFIGKEFWKFLSGEATYYEELINLIDQLSVELIEEFEKSYLEHVNIVRENLKTEWLSEYTVLGKDGLKKFLERYTQ